MNSKMAFRAVKMAAVVIVFAAFTACSNNSSGNPMSPNPNPNPGPGTTAVSISGFAFNPASVTVKMGDKVKWTNMDNTGHTVTSNNGGFASSGVLNQNATYTVTFGMTGTFDYHCSIHPTMTGTVTVTP
jgi:plastocyanin